MSTKRDRRTASIPFFNGISSACMCFTIYLLTGAGDFNDFMNNAGLVILLLGII